MANYYRQFSTVIEKLTPEEIVWCQKRVAHLEKLFNQELFEQDPDRTPDEQDEKLQPEDEAYDIDSGYGSPDLAIKEGIPDHDANLWFASEESEGNLEHIGNFVLEFLTRFRPDEDFILTWSETCDKLREDAFSGGVMRVSVASGIQFWTPTDEIERWRKADVKGNS